MDQGFHERLKEIEAAFEETERRLSDSDVLADQVRYTELTRRHAELRPVVESFHAYHDALQDAREAEELAEVESESGMTADLRALAAERRTAADRIESELRRSAWITTLPCRDLLAHAHDWSIWSETLQTISPLHRILAQTPEEPHLN